MAEYGGYQLNAFVADLYDLVYQQRSQRDVQFFVDYALQAGGRTLELGCGTGRVLLPAARAGASITGLDLSAYMLEKCRQKLLLEPAGVQDRVHLIEGNMTAFATGERYSLVTIPFRPFQHLIEVDQQKDCLSCIHKHLEEDGLLILDLFHTFPPATYDPRYWTEQEQQKDLRLEDGSQVKFTTRIVDFHRDRQYNDIELIYYVSPPAGGSDRLVQAFPFRYFFRYEVEHLLELCGFSPVDLFGDYDRSPFENDSPEMVFVARKR